MTARHRQRRARHEQRWQRRVVAQVERDERAVPDVADRGDAGGERRARVGPRALAQLVVAEPGDLFFQRADAVEHQVLVRVDEAGRERGIAEVEHFGIAW